MVAVGAIILMLWLAVRSARLIIAILATTVSAWPSPRRWAC